MKNTKSVTKEINIVDSITCDRCKKVVFTDDEFELQEMCLIHFTGGYASVFGDGTTVEIDLCQDCLYELTKDFFRVIE